MLQSVAKILETLIAQTEYLVKIKDQVVIYEDKDLQRLLKLKARKLYKAFAFGVNVLITRHNNYKMQLSCLRLLKRFYGLFDKH